MRTKMKKWNKIISFTQMKQTNYEFDTGNDVRERYLSRTRDKEKGWDLATLLVSDS